MTDRASIREQILALVRDYAEAGGERAPFQPGRDRVPYAGRVYDGEEVVALVGAALDFWLTAGPEAQAFEARMKAWFGSRDFFLVNSGSSANLLMVAALCAASSEGAGPAGRLRPGDEVITPAVTFPTTLAPVLQHGLVPVFVDCGVGSYNILADQVEAAIGPRTKALFVPHTLGIPCDMAILGELAARRGLWLLEDGCDALGATFGGRAVGTFGALSSVSFYPAHHMTMGEGGGVVVNDGALRKAVLSLRDWGRDCWCEPGRSDTCGRRFSWKAGQLPEGYDHKYIYSHIGYNLKATDLQAAIGLAQLAKLPGFIAARRRNFRVLQEGLADLEDRLILPELDPRADPSPFGFPVTLREPGLRSRVVQALEAERIETRLLFGGNILRQPGFLGIPHRIAGDLRGSDRIMSDTFFVGVYPGLGPDHLAHVLEAFHRHLR